MEKYLDIIRDIVLCYFAACTIELSYMCPGHNVRLHPHQVKLYRIGCVGSELLLVKAIKSYHYIAGCCVCETGVFHSVSLFLCNVKYYALYLIDHP